MPVPLETDEVHCRGFDVRGAVAELLDLQIGNMGGFAVAIDPADVRLGRVA